MYDIIYIKDGNGNPRGVLKNQIDFKSDLGKIKKRKCKTKVKRTNKCNTKCSKPFWFKGKSYQFFRDYSVWYLNLNTMQNTEKDWKHSRVMHHLYFF